MTRVTPVPGDVAAIPEDPLMHHVQPDTGTTTRTQPPVVRGFGRGWTLGRKLLAVGSVGAILAASVVQSSLSGIARVNTANRAVRSTERVQDRRAHV